MGEAIEERSRALEEWGHKFNPDTFAPIDDQVLIRRDPKKTKVGMIELSASHVKPPWTGVVLKVGPGHRVGGEDKHHRAVPDDKKVGKHPCPVCKARGAIVPMLVKPGDRVYVVHGTGHQLDNTDEYIVVGEGQLLGVER